MNKIYVINKEKGITSYDVVRKIKKIKMTKKVGHTGTLDPMAEGVMVICINDATKLCQFLESDQKEYVAEMIVGTSTDTYDLEGSVVEDVEVKRMDNYSVDSLLESFLGEQDQVPPIYSAIKVDGKKLYQYAREGKTIEIEPRHITIYEIERLEDVRYENGKDIIKFRCVVSKGTYIRSLCFDIAKALGYPGVMKSLIRTRSGIFKIEDAHTPLDIENGTYDGIDMIDAIGGFVKIDDADCCYKARNGMKISPNKVKELINDIPDKIAIIDSNNLVGIYEFDKEIYGYRAVRVWN